MLPDSGHLQEEDASYANRKGYSKHAPALPLYTEDDAWKALERFEDVPWLASVEVAPGVRATFRPAGHILGAAIVVLEVDGAHARRIVFSGDLGRRAHPILLPPAPPPAARRDPGRVDLRRPRPRRAHALESARGRRSRARPRAAAR